ncbi:MAG: DUF1015 domain-containing protein [Chitinophagales bacterium]
MAIIKPFQAFRPQQDKAEKIASRPYDVLNSQEAREEAKGNELSFLRINKPEIDLKEGIDTYSKEVYQQGKKNLDEFIEKEWLIQDDKPCYYIYEQQMGKHIQKGLVCTSSIDDYFDDVIKKHEYTRPKKENDRIEHMATLSAHIGPVFLTYKPVKELDGIIENWANNNDAIYDFESEDKIGHRVWKIDDKTTIDQITAIFDTQINKTYVADGHHRSAASAKVGQRLREQNPNYTGNESFNYFLSVLFPADQLQIIDYNRVIKDMLPDISTEEFLTALLTNFSLTAITEPVRPSINGEFGLYIDKQWYKLSADQLIMQNDDAVESLDISILSRYVIDPLLGISDQRTDERIDFVGGIRGVEELARRVDSGEMCMAFAIHPVTIEQLIAVADSGNVMPPKSTWFEPKLRSGLFVHKF